MSRPPGVSGSPVQVTPAYSYLSDKLRRLSAGSLQCSLFCGGRGCKYESGRRWAGQDKALRGLFSHWVTPDILAMARPSTHLIRSGDLIAQFKRNGIGSVINLQLPREHAKCGPGLEQTSGFTYCPEEFMNNGVFFYNYGWEDYGVPTLTSILDMVKVMDFALGEGKVAIHCHAGLGRTGVLIACYLAFSLRLGGPEAVAFVRQKRPGSVQNRSQIEIVHEFAAFLHPLWVFFPTRTPIAHSPTPSPDHTHNCTPSGKPLGLGDLIRNQGLILHGPTMTDIRDIPKVVHELCGRLMELGSADSAGGSCDALELSRILEQWSVGGELSDHNQCKVDAIQAEVNGCLQWELLHSEPSPSPLLHLLSLFLSSLKGPVLSVDDDVMGILSQAPPPAKSALAECIATTVLRITDTLGQLLQEASKATPTIGVTMTMDEATPPLGVHRTVGVKLAADLHQRHTNTAAAVDEHVQRTCDALIKYWRQE